MDATRGPVRYRGTARDRLCWTIPASPSTPPCHCRREGHGARGHAPGGCGATPARRPGSGQKEGPEPRRTPPRISTANARSSGAPAVLQPTRSARTRPVAWSTAPSRCQHRGTGRGFAPAQTTPLRLGCSRRRTSHPPASQWNRGCASGCATREDRLVAGVVGRVLRAGRLFDHHCEFLVAALLWPVPVAGDGLVRTSIATGCLALDIMSLLMRVESPRGAHVQGMHAVHEKQT